MSKKDSLRRLTAQASILTLICSLLFSSCQEKENVQFLQEAGKSESEISRIEEETGMIFFKRDLTLTDESGKNKVTIRIAGVDESMVNEYVKYRALSIVPIYERKEREKKTLTTVPQKDQSIKDYNNYGLTLIIEIIHEELAEGVVGLGLRNEPNPLYKFEASGRTQYNYQTQHVSNNWPSNLGIKAFTYDPEGVTFSIGYKDRWYSSWHPVFGPATWCCNEFNDFDVDGPYRARVDIAYNSSSDYYLQFFY